MKNSKPFQALRQNSIPERMSETTGKKSRKMRSNDPHLLLGCSIAGLTIIMMSGSVSGQSAYTGSWENFTVISAAGVTNTGPSIVFGNIGLYPTPSITGFPPGLVANGTVYGPSPLTQIAQGDSRLTWVSLMNSSSSGNLSGIDLGSFGSSGTSAALVPDVYTFDTSAQLTGTLELNANVPNAVFVFQIGTTLTTASDARVVITGEHADCAKVYWQVGSSATLGTRTAFLGNILADISITFNTGATLLNGRAIALTGAVTLDSNSLATVEEVCVTGPGSGPGSVIVLTPDMLTPDELTAIFQMGFSAAAAQNLNIQRHLELARRTVRGSTPQSQFAPAPTGSKGGMFDSKSGLSDSKSGLTEQNAMTPQNRSWGVYLEGTDASASVDRSATAGGYEFDTRGVTLGADRRVNDNFLFGILGSYNSLDANFSSGGGIEGESYKAAIYATLFKDGWFVDALIGAGRNSYDTSRPSLLGFAEASPDGWELDTMLNAGYDIQRGNWTITPTASAAYTRVTLNSFTETGSLSPLRFPTQTQDSLRTDLGVKVAYSANFNNGMVLTPQVRVAWQHEFLDSTQSIASGFVGFPGSSFNTYGPDIDRDRLMLSAGLNVQFTPTLNAYAYYDGQLGNSNISTHSVTVGVRLEF
jgi:uncharacterized protein with beta-barrel porin domain